MRTRILFLPLIIALLFASCHKDDVVVLSEPNIPLPEGISEALAFELLVHQVESTTLNVLHSLSERDRGAANTHINFNIFPTEEHVEVSFWILPTINCCLVLAKDVLMALVILY